MGAGGYQRSRQEFEPGRILLRPSSGESVRVQQRPRLDRRAGARFRTDQFPGLSGDGDEREDGQGADGVFVPATRVKPRMVIGVNRRGAKDAETFALEPFLCVLRVSAVSLRAAW